MRDEGRLADGGMHGRVQGLAFQVSDLWLRGGERRPGFTV